MTNAKTLLTVAGFVALAALSLFTLRAVDSLDGRLAAGDRALEERLQGLVRDELPAIARRHTQDIVRQETQTALGPIENRLGELGRRIDALDAAQTQARRDRTAATFLSRRRQKSSRIR